MRLHGNRRKSFAQKANGVFGRDRYPAVYHGLAKCKGFAGRPFRLDRTALRGRIYAGKAPLPGLFNECRLYVNGREVAHRKQGKLWWLNDYRFEWDVHVTRTCRSGENIIALRVLCEHHLGGMFRRPFLYRPVGK
jgi:hypothetical protein